MSGNYHASEQLFLAQLVLQLYNVFQWGNKSRFFSAFSWKLVGGFKWCAKAIKNCLVVWNIFLFFPYIGNNNPNWRTHSIPQVMVGFPGHAELTLIPWIWIFSGITIWNLVCWCLFFSVFFLRIDAKSDVSLNLFGGLGTWFIFPYGNVIIPTDFHSIIFQRGRAQPPTRNVRGFLPNPRSFFGLSSSSARQRTLGSPTLKAVGFVRRISSEIHARRIHKTQLLERSSSWAGIYKIIIDYIFAH